MATFFDELVSSGLIKPGKITEQAVVVKAHNVADYFYMSNPKEVWDLDSSKDFPNIAPPFNYTFVEWNYSKSNNHGKITESVHLTLGTLIESHRVDDGWECKSAGFIRGPGSLPMFFCGTSWRVDKSGRVIPVGGQWNFVVGPAFLEELKRGGWAMHLHVPFMTFSLMHCKNVEMKQSEPHDDALQKARARKGKKPLVRFHTLLIEPFKKAVKDATGSETLTRQALHICHGHFRTYDEKPLFGRVRGTFWVPMHKRGSVSEGIVEKDYAVVV